MMQDPIVKEVRRIREEHEKQFNYDLHAICEDFRKRQLSSGHVIVSRKPRKPIAIPAAAGSEGFSVFVTMAMNRIKRGMVALKTPVFDTLVMEIPRIKKTRKRNIPKNDTRAT